MRLSQKARRSLAGGSSLLLAGAVLVSGCSSIIEGRPVAMPGAGPTEPSFPTPRMTPPSAPADGHPESGAADHTGRPDPAGRRRPAHTRPKWLRLHRNQVRSDALPDQQRQRRVRGTVHPLPSAGRRARQRRQHHRWRQRQLGARQPGAIPTVTIDYKTYDAQGWTIIATSEGTRFTNGHTGHGMFVSIDKVNTF